MARPTSGTADEPTGSGTVPVGIGDPETFWDPRAIPAATVMIVRNRPGVGTETLMLRRDRDLTFAGGMWVFPGGRIDESDIDADPDPPRHDHLPRGRRLEVAARRAAVRETTEEAGLRVDEARLVRWSHWTAPPQTTRRFTTAFYLTVLDGIDAEVRIDDHEIREYQWMTPEHVIEGHAAGELGLTPPTFITLKQLSQFDTTAELLADAPTRPVEHFATRFVMTEDRMIAMYHGDAGYESADPDSPGERHRLTLGSPWLYERTV